MTLQFEIKFNTIRKVLWKYEVFFDFIFGQTASLKWFYDIHIIASFWMKITYNVTALEMSLISYFEYGHWITHTFLLCLCLQFNGQRITQFLVSLYIYASNIFISIFNVYAQRITQFFLVLFCYVSVLDFAFYFLDCVT